MSFRRGFNLDNAMSVLSASSLSDGPCAFNNKLYIALAKGSSQYLVEHSIVGERAPVFVQDIAWRHVVSCWQSLP